MSSLCKACLTLGFMVKETHLRLLPWSVETQLWVSVGSRQAEKRQECVFTLIEQRVHVLDVCLPRGGQRSEILLLLRPVPSSPSPLPPPPSSFSIISSLLKSQQNCNQRG